MKNFTLGNVYDSETIDTVGWEDTKQIVIIDDNKKNTIWISSDFIKHFKSLRDYNLNII